MQSFVIKGRGKIRVVHLTRAQENRRQRIKRVETITAKGKAPMRYPQRCHAALTEFCLRCYNVRESAEQALKALLQGGGSVKAGG